MIGDLNCKPEIFENANHLTRESITAITIPKTHNRGAKGEESKAVMVSRFGEQLASYDNEKWSKMRTDNSREKSVGLIEYDI